MKNFFSQKNLLAWVFWTLALPFGWSQVQTPLDIALRHIEQTHEAWGLTDQDVADMVVNYQYASKHTGVTHIYFLQRHAGIEVYNAMLNVNITSEGKVLFVGKRFIPGLSGKVNTTQPALTPWDAIQQAASQLGYSGYSDVRLVEKTGDHSYRYSGGTLSRSDINVALRYQSMENGTVKLAWDLDLDNSADEDHWSVRVDAQTGAIIARNNWTVYCQFDADPYHNHDRTCRDQEDAFVPVKEAVRQQNRSFLSDDAVYNVFPLPVESPNHGNRELLSSPADLIASPFGWHDVDGVTGAEFEILRGNNVYAFRDGNADEAPDGDVSGGASLAFDFPYNADWEPTDMVEASITNLFYANNMMHDITYQYGFDEAAGNYQDNNYGNGGMEGDHVNAMGQFGGDDPAGLNALNNANFSLAPDGSNGRMRMYYWNVGTRLLEVTAPAVIAGLYSTGVAEFGPAVADQPVSGQVVEVNDGVAEPYLTDACEEPFVNTADLAGKIALIDRGGCYFEQKALYAEQAGAIGVIICNYADEPMGMAGVAGVDDPAIPTISISSTTCALIRQYAGTSLEVNLAVPSNPGPEYLPGDFDNGVITHEYGHGISSRLTGGPFQVGCLGGDEQMGEGWSDFFSLIMTAEPGDQGADRRGIGTYVERQPVTGKGIRTYPYSTDMSENPFTYKDIIGESVPHGVGSVWGTMLWDLYWAFADQYGWDPDIYNGTGGNNMAIQLVMDGMKIQPCDPGFKDGRDAILAADQALYGGANQCLIWEVFARRGLGYYADQGSPYTVGDEKEDFEPLPTCIQELKITKSATDFVEPGDEIDYTIYVINHKPETVTNVVVSDELPAGVTFVNGSGSITPTVNGNLLTFELGDLAFGDAVTITYRGATDPGLYSIQYYLEDAEESIFGEWIDYPTGTVEGTNIWSVQDLFYHSQFQAFFVEDIETESQQVFQSIQPQAVQGDQPVLRFYHWYDTEPGFDGGFVEVSTDGGNSWSGVGDKIFRNPYTGPIAYTTFTVPNLSSFSGNSLDWIASYVDLSEYAGEEILIRFKFGTDEQQGGLGWFLDDIELMDMLNYNSEACVTSDQGDNACAEAPARGTIVDSQLPSGVNDVELDGLTFALFPNPAQDVLNVRLTAANLAELSLRILTVDGKEMLGWHGALSGTQTLPVDVSRLPEGMYMVQVVSGGAVAAQKIVIH